MCEISGELLFLLVSMDTIYQLSGSKKNAKKLHFWYPTSCWPLDKQLNNGVLSWIIFFFLLSPLGNTESESPTSQEVNELQDRLKNSLKLQVHHMLSSLKQQESVSLVFLEGIQLIIKIALNNWHAYRSGQFESTNNLQIKKKTHTHTFRQDVELPCLSWKCSYISSRPCLIACA